MKRAHLIALVTAMLVAPSVNAASVSVRSFSRPSISFSRPSTPTVKSTPAPAPATKSYSAPSITPKYTAPAAKPVPATPTPAAPATPKKSWFSWGKKADPAPAAKPVPATPVPATSYRPNYSYTPTPRTIYVQPSAPDHSWMFWYWMMSSNNHNNSSSQTKVQIVCDEKTPDEYKAACEAEAKKMVDRAPKDDVISSTPSAQATTPSVPQASAPNPTSTDTSTGSSSVYD